MPRRTDNGYGSYSSPPSSTCPECAQKDAKLRSRHYLALVQRQDLDALRDHLTEQCVTLRDPERQRPDLVHDACVWVANLIEQFSGFPDDVTGEPMPWWQARDMMATSTKKLAELAYAKAPEAYRARTEGRPVPGFQRARVTAAGKLRDDGQPHTTIYEEPREQMREPGEDDVDYLVTGKD